MSILALTLAQPGRAVQRPPVPALPDPPALERYLLEDPFYPVLLLIVAGVVLFFWLNQAGRGRQALLAAAACLAGAGAMFTLATLVTTTRETLLARTESLVGAVGRADTAAISAMLGPDVRATVLSAPQEWNKEAILRQVESNLGPGGRWAVKEAEVVAAAAAVDGPNTGRTQVRVRVTLEALGLPSLSWWRLHWRRDSDGAWRVTGIDVLEVDGVREPVGGLN
jgi:hypothetical protein